MMRSPERSGKERAWGPKSPLISHSTLPASQTKSTFCSQGSARAILLSAKVNIKNCITLRHINEKYSSIRNSPRITSCFPEIHNSYYSNHVICVLICTVFCFHVKAVKWKQKIYLLFAGNLILPLVCCPPSCLGIVLFTLELFQD